MSKKDNNLIVGLDLGTSKVVAIVADVSNDNNIEIDISNKISNNNNNDEINKNDRLNLNNLDNSEFNMTKNKEKSTQKIFEFADISSNPNTNNGNNDNNNLEKKEIQNNQAYFKNTENFIYEEKEEPNKNNNENPNNKNDENKNFSFKAIPNYNLKDTKHKEDSESSFLNKQKNVINKINLDFKTGIDNLNTKMHSDENNIDEIKYMDDYNSVNNYAEVIKNKIYHLNLEEKRNVEELLNKLNGRYVNQIDWDKQYIKVLTPSQNDPEYEETWAQLENGSDYSGHIKNFMPNGQGKEYRKDGIFYTGEFRNGKWHGQGVITNVNLDTFQGEFVNGCICGI